MDFNKQRNLLKRIRTDLLDANCELHVEFASELIEAVNTLIGRLNCYSTDDDTELETMAVRDGIRKDKTNGNA